MLCELSSKRDLTKSTEVGIYRMKIVSGKPFINYFWSDFMKKDLWNSVGYVDLKMISVK